MTQSIQSIQSIRSGLVSVTFRQLAPEEVIPLAAQAGLDGIEWGGDVHVPHGDIEQARRVRRRTLDAGLAVASYGSYYRVGDVEPCPFEAVLATALALGAPLIRVWAGKRASAEADAGYRERVVSDARRIGELASQSGIHIAFEFHVGTLADGLDTTLQLLRAVAHNNVKTYWQPPLGSLLADNLAAIAAISPWLANVHVFHWGPTPREQMALAEGAAVWLPYLRRIAAAPGERFAMLEFVKDGAPQSFVADAATLLSWLRRVYDD